MAALLEFAYNNAMCGIAGYVLHPGYVAPENLAQTFGSSLRHRGPDGDGNVVRGAACLVNTRLSVIDLAGGKQPFTTDDSQVFLVQNGEIYNYLELRAELQSRGHNFRTSSDTEVLLKAYEEYGPDFVSRCNGMFAVAILDLRHRRLLLYRDRLGVKPLFIYEAREGFYFSSEIKSFLDLPTFPREISPRSVYLYLVYNYVPLPETIYHKVYHVPPATCVTIELESLRRQDTRFWKIENAPEQTANDEVIVEKLDEIFKSAVSLRLRSDVPIGVFLSSGLDSNCVAHALQQAEPEARWAFSIQTEDPRFDESSDAGVTARELGWTQEKVMVGPRDIEAWREVLWQADQPHGDISFIALKKLSAAASRHVKVVYTGDGGDELFAGYEKYLGLHGANGNEVLRQYFADDCVVKETELLPKVCTEELITATGPGAAYELFHRTTSEVSAKDVVNRALYFDTCQLLAGNNLVKVDRMSMAHGVEARSPFLDYRFFEYMLSIPGSKKISANEPRRLQRLLAARYLPDQVIQRKKRMLAVPIGEWFRNELRNYLENFMCNMRWDRGYLRPAYVKQLASEHMAGIKDHRRILRAVIALELWLQSIEDSK